MNKIKNIVEKIISVLPIILIVVILGIFSYFQESLNNKSKKINELQYRANELNTEYNILKEKYENEILNNEVIYTWKN